MNGFFIALWCNGSIPLFESGGREVNLGSTPNRATNILGSSNWNGSNYILIYERRFNFFIYRNMRTNWTKENLESIVIESGSQREVLEKLNIRAAGGNFKTLKKYLKKYEIKTDHFRKSYEKMVNKSILDKKHISYYLVENSNSSRYNVKLRLIKEGILKNICCLCGQDENWKGVKISLILDHINGVHNDNRLENLRIVCPNCNAGLDTFAGKNTKKININKICECGNKKTKNSKECLKCMGLRKRKIERPEYLTLLKEVEDFGYSATGRKYGVSNKSIKKWIISYEKNK